MGFSKSKKRVFKSKIQSDFKFKYPLHSQNINQRKNIQGGISMVCKRNFVEKSSCGWSNTRFKSGDFYEIGIDYLNYVAVIDSGGYKMMFSKSRHQDEYPYLNDYFY